MRKYALTVLFLFSLTGLFSQSDLSRWETLLQKSGYVDNWTVRLKIRDKMNAAPLALKEMPPEIFQSSDPRVPAVKFEFRDLNNSHYILLVNQSEYKHYFEERMKYLQVDLLGRGNWIIKRDPATGEILQAKIFLSHFDDRSFIRISAGPGRSYLDLTVMDKPLYYHVPLAIPMDQAVISPMARILDLSSDSINWEEIFPDASFEEWEKVESLSNRIARSMKLFDYVEDGAMNRWGEWVYIEDGTAQYDHLGFNCSGFTKWLADGFFRRAPFGSQEGELISLERLKNLEPEMAMRSDHSWNTQFEDRDPLFGLLWTRNISKLLWESFAGVKGVYRGQDVRKVPFYSYRENIGYPLKDLEALIYLAAVKNPGQIYWGAVNSQFPLTPQEGIEPLWQYHHVFALLPWFDSQGNFRYKIYDSYGFEQDSDTTLEFLVNHYPEDTWVHLTSSPAWLGFDPVPTGNEDF